MGMLLVCVGGGMRCQGVHDGQQTSKTLTTDAHDVSSADAVVYEVCWCWMVVTACVDTKTHHHPSSPSTTIQQEPSTNTGLATDAAIKHHIPDDAPSTRRKRTVTFRDEVYSPPSRPPPSASQLTTQLAAASATPLPGDVEHPDNRTDAFSKFWGNSGARPTPGGFVAPSPYNGLQQLLTDGPATTGGTTDRSPAQRTSASPLAASPLEQRTLFPGGATTTAAVSDGGMGTPWGGAPAVQRDASATPVAPPPMSRGTPYARGGSALGGSRFTRYYVGMCMLGMCVHVYTYCQYT